MPKTVQQEPDKDDPNRPLEQWEKDWLSEIEARKRRDKDET